MSQIEVRRKRRPYREWRGKRLPPDVRVYFDRLRKVRNYYGPRNSQTPFCAGIEPFAKEWWDAYWTLKAGNPLPVPEVVQKVQTPPGSWDAMILHYKRYNTGWQEMQPSTQSGYQTYLDYISLGDRPA